MKIRVQRRRIVVPGFRFAGVRCGLKASGKRDVGLIVSDRPATVAGAFTTNRVQAAPVVVARERVRSGRAQAILVNSGNANAYTGADGERVARATTRLVAQRLRIDEGLVLPCSTGRIGVAVPRRLILAGVRSACDSLDADGFHASLEAMMTTDAFPKFAVEEIRLDDKRVTIAAMAKGAGMIAPNMATTLGYVLTDANVSVPALRRALAEGIAESFNRIVVDGDMSTNDTVLVLAGGAAGNRALTPRSADFRSFSAAVTRVLSAVSRMIVKDGEGATRLIDLVVRGGRTRRDAERVADAIARSPLCKTAFFGGDPYAGRVICAAGYSGAVFDPAKLDVFLDDVQVVRAGVEIVGRVEKRAARIAASPEFTLTLDLHAGSAEARRVTSDLSTAYVRFNSAYRT
jgi:glutamate N-acetyltransferase/amino-acid N-acetyltransferase